MKLLILTLLIGSFTANAFFDFSSMFMPRDSKFGDTRQGIFTPKSLLKNTIARPAILLLHGCQQNPADLLINSRLDEYADKNEFYVITPKQTIFSNPLRCWNWFNKLNHQRDRFEGRRIMNQLDNAIGTLPIDKDKVYIAGLSAGAGMTNILSYCHAEKFAGSISVAGVPFAAADTGSSALKVMKNGSLLTARDTAKKGINCLGHDYNELKYAPKFMVVQGTKDKVVSGINALQLKDSHLGFLDLLDDSKLNNSLLIQEQTKQVTPAKKHAYTITSYQIYNQNLIQNILIEDMDHAWPGGLANKKYSDPLAPSIWELAESFFNWH